MQHIDYRITEEILSKMWGKKVSYSKSVQQGIRLTPLNLHYEGIKLHEGINTILPNSPFLGDKTSPLIIRPDLIDPQFDYDFTTIKDTTSFFRGTTMYKRPCGWKRLAITVRGVYDEGYNGWLGMANKPGEWINSYMPTDLPKIKEYLKNNATFDEFIKNTYSFDIGIVSMPDVDFAEKFAQTVKVNGVNYKFLIQNRVHPRGHFTLCYGDVFICPKECIRPYGFLIKA